MNALQCLGRARRALPLIVVAACAPANHRIVVMSESLLDPPRQEWRADRISTGELRTFGGSTVLDAVRRLRPEFLQTTAPRTMTSEPALPSVFLNGRFSGGLELLGTLGLTPVVEIQYLTPMNAKNEFGSYCRCEGGVIHVRTRVDP